MDGNGTLKSYIIIVNNFFSSFMYLVKNKIKIDYKQKPLYIIHLKLDILQSTIETETINIQEIFKNNGFDRTLDRINILNYHNYEKLADNGIEDFFLNNIKMYNSIKNHVDSALVKVNELETIITSLYQTKLGAEKDIEKNYLIEEKYKSDLNYVKIYQDINIRNLEIINIFLSINEYYNYNDIIDKEVVYDMPDMSDNNKQSKDSINNKQFLNLRYNDIKDKTQVNHFKSSRLSHPLVAFNRDMMLYLENELKLVDISRNIKVDYNNIRSDSFEKLSYFLVNLKELIKVINLNTEAYELRYDIGKILISMTQSKNYINQNEDDILPLIRNLMQFDIYTTGSESELRLNDELIMYFKKKKTNIFVTMINKLRHNLHNKDIKIDYISDFDKTIHDISIAITKNGCQLAYSKDNDMIFINNHGFNAIIMNNPNKIIICDNAHLDYITTALETKENMDLIINLNEHKSLNKELNLINELIAADYKYNEKVLFFKNIETLCLMKADIFKSNYINWQPILKVITGIIIPNYSHIEMLLDFIGCQSTNYTIYSKIIYNLNELIPPDLINLSTTHKFIFYSEISESKGIIKYLSRTHTKRKYNKESLDLLVYKFRKLFIKNFYKKHNRLPSFDCNDELADKMLNSLRKNDYSEYDEINLYLFNSINFKETFKNKIVTEPIVYAKDKGCSKNYIRFSNHDNIQELTDIMGRQHYELSDKIKYLDFNHSVNVYRSPEIEKELFLPYATRLCMKEREQKEEGRLFGCATTDNKHDLSYNNKFIEIILGYFNHQYIKIDHRDKLENMHKAAQLLLDDDNYSLMLDIEGHNQSIQPELMYGILNEIGKLYNIKDFSKLKNYFTNLDVYYNYTYLNQSIYSKGQLGGIEGWMNQLWTLITLVISELVQEETGIEVLDLLVYSDDVNLIFKSKNMNQLTINEIYKKISNHYFNFGFCVKASQTIISKYRSTLLKVHYYKGVKCEPSLKKILSISSITENLFINEYIDVKSVNSSINSALQDSKTYYTQLFIKWYKIVNLSLKSFFTFIIRNRDNINIINKLMNSKSRQSVGCNYDVLKNMNESDLLKLQVNTYKSMMGEKNISIEEFRGLLSNYKKINRQLKETRHTIDKAFCKDNNIALCFYIKMILPTTISGYNVSTLSQNLLTGHSIPCVRTMSELELVINIVYNNKIEFKRLAKLSIFNKYINSKNPSEDKLLSMEFPVDNDMEDPDRMIKNYVKERLKKICKNESINKYLKHSKNEVEFNKEIINLTRANFCYRIASYYKENSIFYITDYLYNKIESSRSFIKNLYLPDKLYSKLYDYNVFTNASLFNIENLDDMNRKFGSKLETNDNCINLLSTLRKEQYRNILFLNINEVTYNNLIKEVEVGENAHFELSISSALYKTDSKVEYKSYRIPPGVRMKYQKNELEKINSNIILNLLVKNVFLTKWILCKDKIVDPKDNNYVHLCNLSLSTLSHYKYDALSEFVSLPSGGEVLHRIENMKFQNLSYIRCLHNRIIERNCRDHKSELTISYNNSNINFNLLKNMIILKDIIDDTLDEKKRSIYKVYRLMLNDNIIADVDIKLSYNKSYNLSNLNKFSMINQSVNKTDLLNEVNMINRNIEIDLVDKFITNTKERFQNDIISFHRAIKREYLYTDFYTGRELYWKHFFNEIKYNYNRLRNLDFEEFKLEARTTIIEYYNRLRFPGNKININDYISEDFEKKDKILELIDDFLDREKDFFSQCLKNKEFDHSDININRQSTYNKLSSIIKNNDASRDRISLILLKNFIKLKCIVFMEKNGLQINISKSYELLLDKCKYHVFFLEEDSSLVMLLRLIREDLFGFVMRQKEKIKSYLGLLNYNVVSNRPKSNDYKITINMQKEGNEVPKILIDNVIYHYYIIDDFFLKYLLPNSKRLLISIRNQLYLHSDPDAFFSLSGSDAICCNIGIAKFIINEYKEKYKEKKICDLVAGRGDGNFVYSYYQMNITSYSQKNLFNETCKNDNLVYLNYDITNYETIIFVESFDIIIIDISYIQGSQANLFDNIDHLINLNKHVIIRINSLNLGLFSEKLYSRKNSYKLILLLPSGSSLSPYQIFISIQQGKVSMISDIKESLAGRALSLFRVKINKARKINNIALITNRNSVNSKIDIDRINFIDLISEIDKYNDRQKKLNMISNHIDRQEYYKNFIIHKDQRKYFTNNCKSYDDNIFTNILSLEKYSRDNQEEEINHVRLSREDFFTVNLLDIKFEFIHLFSKSIKYHEFRAFFKNINKLKKNNLIIDTTCLEVEKMNNKINEMTIESELLITDSKYVYDVILCLMYIVIFSTYDDTLNELILRYKYSKKLRDKLRFHKLIKNIKLCSNIIPLIADKLNNLSVDDDKLLLDKYQTLIRRKSKMILSNYNRSNMREEIREESKGIKNLINEEFGYKKDEDLDKDMSKLLVCNPDEIFNLMIRAMTGEQLFDIKNENCNDILHTGIRNICAGFVDVDDDDECYYDQISDEEGERE